MSLVLKFSALTFLFCLLNSVQAQDIHFAQTSRTPLLINPAAAGVFNGWERIFVNYRSQWLGSNTQFNTTAVAADANFKKGIIQETAHLGIGVVFFNDVGGDSQFGNQSGSLTLSGILPFDGTGHTFSIGIQGGFGQRSADLSRVTFMSQWDGTQFNPEIISGEANSATLFSYKEVSAGLLYVFDAGKNSFTRHDESKFQIGISGYHLNEPEFKYVSGSVERLHRKYVAHAEYIADMVGSRYSIDMSAIQAIQGGHYETLLGMMLRYRIVEGTKITGYSQNAYFGFGLLGRLKDAIIPTVMLDWNGFQFGLSYDVTLSGLRKAYSGGSIEFSLAYRNLDHALFKTRKRRF